MDKEYVTWKNVKAYIDIIKRRYENIRLTGVFGLPRGGLCLAVMISHRLNIPLLMSPVEGCLIVDDICDSGESLLHYYRNSSNLKKPSYHITTMIYNPNNKLVVPDYYLYEKKDKWIVFPWESEEV